MNLSLSGYDILCCGTQRQNLRRLTPQTFSSRCKSVGSSQAAFSYLMAWYSQPPHCITPPFVTGEEEEDRDQAVTLKCFYPEMKHISPHFLLTKENLKWPHLTSRGHMHKRKETSKVVIMSTTYKLLFLIFIYGHI